MQIQTTSVCFKYIQIFNTLLVVFFNFNKNLKLFDIKSLFYA